MMNLLSQFKEPFVDIDEVALRYGLFRTQVSVTDIELYVSQLIDNEWVVEVNVDFYPKPNVFVLTTKLINKEDNSITITFTQPIDFLKLI